ncbi:MAG: DNA-3-methyladenine glycosylase [Candidatus Saccharimonadales bacterium]
MRINLSDALLSARDLLGCRLVHETPEGLAAGIIVETEAYTQDDPASHTFRGQTSRNSVMYGPAGHAYIYFTYGKHYCFNVVTGPAGSGQAVLIRALQPVEGIELMKSRRQVNDLHNLTNGPAKLVQALAINKEDYGLDLINGGKLRLEAGDRPQQISQTTRIGIKQAVHQPWRFYITGNPFISRT